MTLLGLSYEGHKRRLFWLVAPFTTLWLGCSEAGPSNPGAAGNSSASGSSGAGSGDCEAGAADDCDASGAGGMSSGEGGRGGSINLAGASGAPEAGDAGASGAPDGFVPAPHPPFPLVTKHAGPVLESIQLVPIYFGNDPLRAEIERFNTWIVGSDYWKRVGAEYGVKSGTSLPGLQFEMSPTTISASEITVWLDAHVADGTLPKPNANTVFVLFYQSGVTVNTDTGTSCRAFAGLHNSFVMNNAVFKGEVPFVILPRCSYSPGDELMIVTDVASHELIEAATNPFPLTNPSWIMDNHSGPLEAWEILSGPAIADLCLNQSYDEIEGFSVQNIWSNAAAKAGNNPCQPSDPQHPFFTVSAEETIYHAQPGSTVSIVASAWSNRPMSDWEIAVNWGFVPYSDFDGNATLDRNTINNGEEVKVTVTIPANPPLVDGRSVYRFMVESIDPINPNFSHPWPFLVVVP